MTKERLDKLRAAGYVTAANRIEAGRCPLDNRRIQLSKFRDEIETNEFDISGMCHVCQKKFFEASGAIRNEAKT